MEATPAPTPAPESAPAPQPQPAPEPSSKRLFILLGILAVVVLGGGGVYAFFATNFLIVTGQTCEEKAVSYTDRLRTDLADPAAYVSNLATRVDDSNGHCYTSYQQQLTSEVYAYVVDVDSGEKIVECLIGGDFADSHELVKKELATCFARVEAFMNQLTVYENAEVGYQVLYPSTWNIEENENSIILKSPDYSEKKIEYVELGTSTLSITASGFAFTLPKIKNENNNLSESLRNPSSFVEFYIPVLEDCSNCPESRAITLDDRPALLKRSQFVGTQGEIWEFLRVETVHDGTIFGFNYSYSTYSSEARSILENFLIHFRFIK